MGSLGNLVDILGNLVVVDSLVEILLVVLVVDILLAVPKNIAFFTRTPPGPSYKLWCRWV